MIPSMIYPACDILLNAIKRFKLLWRMANRLAMVMVATMTTHSISLHWAVMEPNTLTKMAISAKAAAPFEITDR